MTLLMPLAIEAPAWQMKWVRFGGHGGPNARHCTMPPGRSHAGLSGPVGPKRDGAALFAPRIVETASPEHMLLRRRFPASYSFPIASSRPRRDLDADDSNTRRAHAQPQERRSRSAAGSADRVYRP